MNHNHAAFLLTADPPPLESQQDRTARASGLSDHSLNLPQGPVLLWAPGSTKQAATCYLVLGPQQ